MALIVDDRILDTSTTTGTGPFTVAGSVINGYKPFNAVCSTSDTFYGTIQTVDANGTPTGDWVTGLFTYSAANQITVTTVHKSSNSNSAVTFGAGTKQIFIDATATYLGLKELAANKDASGGYVGRTLYKVNLPNNANTFTSTLANTNTAARAYVLQDRDGTLADLGANTFVGNQTITGALSVSSNVSLGTSSAQQLIDLGDGTTGGRGISWGGASGTAQFGVISSVRGTGGVLVGYGLDTSTSVSSGYVSSYSSSTARSGIVVRDGVVQFYADSATTVTKGTAVTPTEQMQINTSGVVVSAGSLRVQGAFGCNNASAQSSFTLGAAATDLATVITLANNLRTMARNNGTGA